MPLHLAMSGKRIPMILLIVLAFMGIFLFQGNISANDDPVNIAIENDPRMLAINPLTNRAVVTHGHSNAVSIVDLNTERVITKLHVGRLPQGVAIDTEMNLAVVTNQGERSVTLIDLNKNQVVADIHIGNFTSNVAVNSRTHIAAVTSIADQHVYFIDLTKRTIVNKIFAGIGLKDIAIDPVRNTALLLNQTGKNVTIMDMTHYTIIDTIALSYPPQAIDVNPETHTALITGYRDHTLTLLDLLNRRSFIIPAGKYPLDVAYNTIDNRAVVLCERDKKLLLLDLKTNQLLKTYALPRHPQSVAVNSLKNIAVVADDEKDGLTIIPLPLSPTLPKIKITSPPDNAQIQSDTVTVTGTVENSSGVTVNGIAAAVSGNTFSATLTLKAGLNTIAAIATDQYGRTACHNIIVEIVPPKTGKITGTITNAATGELLPSAIVTITDARGDKQTITTIISGTFDAKVAVGAFTGAIAKPWYLPYSFSGSVAAGKTAVINASLTPAEPQISNITVSEITANSAKISWTKDQPATGRVEYGKTTTYGITASDSVEDTTHSVRLTNLSPKTTYHFRVAAVSGNGTTTYSANHSFKTAGEITITITSPANGANIGGNSVIVVGSVTNASNVETGVTVNGIAASLNNNQFAVNNVPLTAGANTITVIATDVNGATASKSITVNAASTANFIKLSATPESGIPPLKVTVNINGSFSVSKPVINVIGPGPVIERNVTGPQPEDYQYIFTTEGIYLIIASAVGPDNITYSDAISITVLSLEKVDATLKAKWTALTNALKNKNIASALTMLSPVSRDRYQTMFNLLTDQLPVIVAAHTDLVLDSIKGDFAFYELKTLENGSVFSYRVIFTKDPSTGLWLIEEF